MYILQRSKIKNKNICYPVNVGRIKNVLKNSLIVGRKDSDVSVNRRRDNRAMCCFKEESCGIMGQNGWIDVLSLYLQQTT